MHFLLNHSPSGISGDDEALEKAMIYVVEQDLVDSSCHRGGAGGGVGWVCEGGVIDTDTGIPFQLREENYFRLPAIRIVTVELGFALHAVLIHIDDASGASGVV